MDTWEKSYHPEEFPDELDVDGDGMLYYLMDPSTDWAPDTARILNVEEYDSWLASYLEGGVVQQIPWLSLSRENVECQRTKAE